MKLTPAKPRNRKISGVTRNYAWAYVPGEPMTVPDEVGRVLLTSGAWVQVETTPKREYKPKRLSTNVDTSSSVDTVESADDGTQSDTSRWGA